MDRRLSRIVIIGLLSLFPVAGFAQGNHPVRPHHVILTVARPLNDADRRELAAEGVEIQRPLGGDRFVARVEDDASAAADPRFKSVAPLTLSLKVHPSAWRLAAAGKPFIQVRVFFHDDTQLDSAREAVNAAGGELEEAMTTTFQPLQSVVARIPSTSLSRLATDEHVLVVYGARPYRPTTWNATAALLSHVTELQAAPYSLSGSGVVLSYFELAPAYSTHPEFQGRLTVEFQCTTTDCKDADNVGHATHTGGTMIAAGLNPAAKGMAPAATLHEYLAADNNGDWLTTKQTTLKSIGSVADNNSWGYILGWTTDGNSGWTWNAGEELIGGYTGDLNAVLDHVALTNGSLMVHSAGNDASSSSSGGPRTAPYQHNHINQDDPNFASTTDVYCVSANGSGTDCVTPCKTGNDKWGDPYCEITLHPNHIPTATNPGGSIGWTASSKNIVAVGATNNAQVVASFSSRGPTKDGRVKPDLVAKGQSLFSTWTGGSYKSEQGTSMAAPVVTGSMALLVEQWRKSNAGASPLPAALKALAIAGADDLGNPGPDYTYGFGFLNTKKAVDLIIADGGAGKRVKIDSMTQGGSLTYPLNVASSQSLRVVLTWFDPEVLPLGSDEVAGKTLVNDLDIKVIGPDGTTLPYVLDVNNPGQNATRGVNTVDTVEEIEIPSATPGSYQVVVSGTDVPKGPQQFVLVGTADFGAAVGPCSDVTEPNETVDTAFGPLTVGDAINARICSATDIDFFKFTTSAAGTASVTVTATDTPLLVTLAPIGSGGSPATIAAGTSQTLSAAVGSAATAFFVKVVPAGTVGATGAYTIVANYPFSAAPRRRGSSH